VQSCLIALLVGFAVLSLPEIVRVLVYAATAVLAMLVAFRGVRVHRPANRRGWLLLLTGLSGWVAGDLIWRGESWDGAAPFPAPSDAVYLASYLVLGAGVLVMVRSRRSGSDRAAVLDAAILTTGVAVLATVFVILPVGRDATLSTSAKLVSSAYPVGDVFLLAILTRLLASSGARNSSFRLLLGALLVTTVADSAWNVLVVLSGDTGPDEHWLNVGWLGAYVLVAIAANRPSMAQVAAPGRPGDVWPIGWRRLVAMAVGLLLPPAVLFVDGADGAITSWPVIAVGATVMSVLVLLRFVDLFSVVQAQAVQLAALARTDALTGVANRRTWDHELSRACRSAREQHRRLAVAILDIDHFKAFNDTYGHQAGDELLREAATAWSAALPPGAFLARYGGEEFAVLLPELGVFEAHAVITAMRSRTPRGQSFSAGVVERRRSGPATPADLVAAADKALYRAKRGGRNRVVMATGDRSRPVGQRADVPLRIDRAR
jgi:diguanylate cyclase (GGDEF)-like protein